MEVAAARNTNALRPSRALVSMSLMWRAEEGCMPDKRLWRDASGRLTFDLCCVEAEEYPAVTCAVADAFALSPDGSLVVGPEQMFWDFRRGEQVIGFDWDIWMGFMVVAKTEGAEPLVEDIASWLELSRWAGERESA